MKKLHFIIIAAISVLLVTSCAKEESHPSGRYPYSFYIDVDNETTTPNVGGSVAFGVVLQYIDGTTIKEEEDDGTLTNVSVTEGLKIDSFGTVTAVSYRDDTEGTETVTVTLPNGYMNGSDMIKVVTINVTKPEE